MECWNMAVFCKQKNLVWIAKILKLKFSGFFNSNAFAIFVFQSKTIMHKETKAIHSGTQFDEKTQGTNSPIYTSTAIGYLDSNVTYPRYFNTKNQLAVAEK